MFECILKHTHTQAHTWPYILRHALIYYMYIIQALDAYKAHAQTFLIILINIYARVHAYTITSNILGKKLKNALCLYVTLS